MLAQKNISARQIAANRANARRSTGPKSARGRANSRKNALRHGLTSSAVLFDAGGVPTDPQVRRLWERLRNETNLEDEEKDSLVEKIATEWAHQLQAIELEKKRWEPASADGASGIRLHKLNRYRRKSQRALLTLLERLRQRVAP